MKLLIDTNVILDFLLKREPFFKDSVSVLRAVESVNYAGFITSTTITDIYYIAKKSLGHARTIFFLTELLIFVEILGIGKSEIRDALISSAADFEDAVQQVAATRNGIEYIITRNTADFTFDDIKALTPSDFIRNATK